MPSTHGVEFRIDQFTHFIPSQGCNEQQLAQPYRRVAILSVMEITSQGRPGASARLGPGQQEPYYTRRRC
jgi:hypothetical protein